MITNVLPLVYSLIKSMICQKSATNIGGFHLLNVHRTLTWARNAPLFGAMLFYFIPFHNYLVISTVTYFVKIYKLNTNVYNVYKLEV